MTVFMETERQRQGANAHQPAFLQGNTANANTPDWWFKHILPYVEGLTFNLKSTSDIEFMGVMLASPYHPQLFTAITKVEIPNFYWVSGTVMSRPHNPYFQMAKNLPNLRHLSFRLHNAGMTTSAFSERRMIELEAEDLERSKERRCMHWKDVVYKYELGALLECHSLRQVRIEYLECEMTAHFTKTGNIKNVLQTIQNWMGEGFDRQGQTVDVVLVPSV